MIKRQIGGMYQDYVKYKTKNCDIRNKKAERKFVISLFVTLFQSPKYMFRSSDASRENHYYNENFMNATGDIWAQINEFRVQFRD